jgi:S-adenosylmethionine:tRNA ribosyltransferase-isomerase
LIGGKKIGEGDVLKAHTGRSEVRFEVLVKKGSDARVKICFETGTFGECLESLGQIPLPPYIKREAEASDSNRYQTVYSTERGSVAAPTAGLHFSKKVLEELKSQGIETAELILHVGGGTFRPVKTEHLEDHPMHAERFRVLKPALFQIIKAKQEGRPIVAVGTTSLRTLESLYWIGALGIEEGEKLSQWDWKKGSTLSCVQSFESLLKRAEASGVSGTTEIMVLPPYDFRVVDALVTNFHQPGSTLLALVAAFVGHPNWQEIYRKAQDEGYRFLSYGDSSLLFRSG